MSFAGTFGAAANLVPFGILRSPLYGQATGYDANGNLQFTSAGGKVFTPERIDELRIVGTGNVLGVLTDNTDDGSAVDTGVLVTAAPGANQHGLPANFGPGRGNWTQLEQDRTEIQLISGQNTIAAGTNTGGPQVRVLGLNVADLEISIKNQSEVVLATSVFRVVVNHSIQG